MATSGHVKQNSTEKFLSSSGIGQLTHILSNHLTLIKEKDKDVQTIIEAEHAKSVLTAAKTKALQNERMLLTTIMDDIDEMNEFLKNIILIENLFNSIYKPNKSAQETARTKFAPSINKYENKGKVNSNANSFVELIFGAQTHVSSFQNWIDKVTEQCKKDGIKIKSSSNAQIKKIERAFYKAFYVYENNDNGTESYNEMTDVLRCSFVFDEFEDLYKCFTVIELLASEGGILRAKDRFQPDSIEFGYRDMLLNMYCPGSQIVSEIQLHWYPLYKYKKISHKMYKLARLFERDDGNAAYDYSHKYFQKKIGSTKLYQPSKDELDSTTDDEHSNTDSSAQESKDNTDTSSNAANSSDNSAKSLLESWGLGKYVAKMTEEGWDDPLDWKELTSDDLINDIGFAKGHVKKFQRKFKEWQENASKKSDNSGNSGKNAAAAEKESKTEDSKENDNDNWYDNIDGGGWRLVRRVKKGAKWHPSTDHCRGSDSYGLDFFGTRAVSNKDCNIDHTFSLKFDNMDFNEYLFTTGDGKLWVIVKKSDVERSGRHTNKGMQNRAVKSSVNENSYEVYWYNRGGNREDPWISLYSHFDSIADGTMLYGGNSWGNAYVGHCKSLMEHNGACVFIRNKSSVKSGSKGGYEDSIDGGGWRLVRRVKKGAKWHPSTDHCRGSESYGLDFFGMRAVSNDDRSVDHTFSIKFDNIQFKEYLFTTGDGKLWVIVKKSDVERSGQHTNKGMKNRAVKSSVNENSYEVYWYNRGGNKEDPWISLYSHFDSIADGTMLYGGNSWGNANVGHCKSLLNHNGANVFIR